MPLVLILCLVIFGRMFISLRVGFHLRHKEYVNMSKEIRDGL